MGMSRKWTVVLFVLLVCLAGRSDGQDLISKLVNLFGGGGGNKNELKEKIAGLLERAMACANSDEFDSEEAMEVYSPRTDERFMPPSCGLTIEPCNHVSPYRTFSGSCNNYDRPDLGVPNSTYIRVLPSRYANNIRAPRRAVDGSTLPSARMVRTNLFPTGAKSHNQWNLLTMLLGQFLAHDMSLLRMPEHNFPCCTPDGKFVHKLGRFCYPIKIPEDDPTMGRAGIYCLNFTRTVTDKDMGCSNDDSPAEQINAVTSYLDLSNVYGLNRDMANGLRSRQGGRLKIETRNNRVYAPRETTRGACPCRQANENACYMTGDSRSNQNPQLAILQILFVREHNRIAGALSKLNPHWNDEKLFQEARRILIAMYQRIIYYELLPIYLGRDNLLEMGIIYNQEDFIDDYDPEVNAGVTNEHANAAFRLYHTHIAGLTNMMDRSRRTTNSMTLSNWWNRPEILERGDNMEQLTIGMLTQKLEDTDAIHVEDVTDKLFACGRRFGIDLKAADIQRDRDHGLGYYNEYRALCDLKVANSFSDYGDLISVQNVKVLRSLYRSHADVDLSVGGALERLAPGAECGPTYQCIMNDQFKRSRVGDRFWFENPNSGFTKAQLAQIRKATISRMFCDSGDGITQIQPNGLKQILSDNSLQPCSSIPKVDLSAWKEGAGGSGGNSNNNNNNNNINNNNNNINNNNNNNNNGAPIYIVLL